MQLFGPPIRDIWLPKTADVAVDGILISGLIILAIDIIIRCIVDKSYFGLDRNASAWAIRRLFRCKCCNLHIGSHMFWFDIIGVLTSVFNLSMVWTPIMVEFMELRVTLNEYGFSDGGYHSNPPSIQLQWTILLTVGRVCLMARFIRTSVLAQISSIVYNLRYFHLAYWMQKLTPKSRREGREGGSMYRQAMSSEKVLASTSARGRANSDPFSVSDLGDSTKKRNSSLTGFEDEGQLDFSEKSIPEEEEESPKPKAKKAFFKGFKRKVPDAADTTSRQGSLLFGRMDDSRSHVGAAMRELTGQRIATGALLALTITVLCDWRELDTTQVMTMQTLHGQTANLKFAKSSVDIARSTVIPSLFKYTRVNETSTMFSEQYFDASHLRDHEILKVDVGRSGSDEYTFGQFDQSRQLRDVAKIELVTTIIILVVWALGVASFAGPIMTLVVDPIERMVRLLSMLMKDPLGYQSTRQYRNLKRESEEIAHRYKSVWPREVLKGMETNFLMSTILRIGSLMRVGFGSAGVEIIRNNLERGRHKDVLFLSKQGGTVSCVFLFCDIRQFTDATECLQEEVFVFTNKIAAVVHSICHSYGGSANKNIGDAFLLSWLLDEKPEKDDDELDFNSSSKMMSGDKYGLCALKNQADKALLSVVKISMALHYDNYFVETMNEAARKRLLTKLSTRKGPIVQMGFGLHAGKAVQGAIGSQRKLDATYISESVERAEFLESSTKKYGVPMLISDAFYSLLSAPNRHRCRKVDQLVMQREENGGADPNELLDSGEKMSIYTFDMDIEALWTPSETDDDASMSSTSDTHYPSQRQSRNTYAGGKATVRRGSSVTRRASSYISSDLPGFMASTPPTIHRRPSFMPGMLSGKDSGRSEMKSDIERAVEALSQEQSYKPPKDLVLPNGVQHYDERVWLDSDIKRIRLAYVSSGIIFPKYKEGLAAYFAKDWQHAKQCFEFVLVQRDDGPSRLFLKRIAEHDGIPPRDFIGYTIEQF